MKISLIQYAPIWEDASLSLLRLDKMIFPLSAKTDLIVLPEMFATGFSMNTGKICSGHNYRILIPWMRQTARYTGAMVVGGLAVMEDEKCYNRFNWTTTDRGEGFYDKHHLFTMSGEHKHYSAGKEQKQFEWLGWQIKPIVCYDLRFPELCRNNRTKPYDLLICIASWPAVRSDVWLTLLKARALENQCYVVGVNRVGTDGNGLQHKGDSIIYSPKGEIIGRIPENEETVATFEISHSELHHFRKKFPVLDDMDEM